MNNAITFIEEEKEKWYSNNYAFGGRYLYPNYMLKDGKRYFIFNRGSDARGYDIDEQEARKSQLLSTNGQYFKFNGAFASPIEMLKWIVDNKYHFCSITADNVQYQDGTSEDHFDFHGNLVEISAAFFYRIYDKELVKEIETLLEQIPKPKKKGAYPMTPTQLTEIIRTADKKAITKQLRELGYTYCDDDRKLGKVGIIEIVNAVKYETDDFSDAEHKHLCNGRICGTVKGYESYEFVFVNVYDIKPSSDPFDDEETAIQTEMLIWAKEIQR